jgi:hypothetical protein
MRNLLLLLFIAISLVSCASLQSRNDFDMSLDKYNRLVRWGDLDRAALFSAAPISEEFRERAKAAGNVKITDYQVMDVNYNEKALEASAVVTFSYYVLTSGLVTKTTDNQKWVYIEEGGVKAWRLKSLLPEFR